MKGISYISNLSPIQKLRLKIRNRFIGKLSIKDTFENYKYNDFINLFNIIFILNKNREEDINAIKLFYLNIIKEIDQNTENNKKYIKKITKNGINQSNKTKKLISLFENKDQLNKIFPDNDDNTNNFIMYLLKNHFDNFYVLINIDSEKYIYITIKIIDDIETIRKFTYNQLKTNLDKINLLIQPCTTNVIEKDSIYYNNVLSYYVQFYQNKLCNTFIMLQIKGELQILTLLDSEDYKRSIYNFKKIIDNINLYTSNYYLKMLYSFNTETFDFDSDSKYMKGGDYFSYSKKNKTPNILVPKLRVELLKALLYNYNVSNNFYNIFINDISSDELKFPAISLNYDLQNTSLYVGFMNEINYNLEDIDRIINFEKILLDKNHVNSKNLKNIKNKAQSYKIIAAEKILSVVSNKLLQKAEQSGCYINTENNIIFEKILINIKKDINAAFISDFFVKNKLESLIDVLNLVDTDFNPYYLKSMKGFNSNVIISSAIKKIYTMNENFDNINSKLEITFSLTEGKITLTNKNLFFNCEYINKFNLKDIVIEKVEEDMKKLILFNIKEFIGSFIKFLDNNDALINFLKKLLNEDCIVKLFFTPTNIQLFVAKKENNSYKIVYLDTFYLTILFSFTETNESVYFNINNRDIIIKLRELDTELKKDLLYTEENEIFDIIITNKEKLNENIIDYYNKISEKYGLKELEIVAKEDIINVVLKNKDNENIQNIQNFIFYLNIYNRNIYYFIDYLTNHRSYTTIKIYLLKNNNNFLNIKIVKSDKLGNKSMCEVDLQTLSIITFEDIKISFAVFDIFTKIVNNDKPYFKIDIYSLDSINKFITLNKFLINKIPTDEYIKTITNKDKKKQVQLNKDKYKKNLKNTFKNAFEFKNNKMEKIMLNMSNNSITNLFNN